MFNALKQTEIQLQIIGEVLEDDLVTKQEFKLLQAKMESGFDSLSKKIEYEVATIGGRFERLENRLTIRFAAFLLVGLTALASVIKFWLAR